ncbi:MAG: T9SS type A sorting domain-containing protein [Bacteroidales bacterium]
MNTIKLKITLFSFLTFLSLVIYSQTKKVLFLGNSYTYVNDLPQLTANLAISAGDTLLFDSHTPGGYSLEDHSTNSISLEKIMQGHLDFMILQDQSQRPAMPINQVIQNVFPHARALDSINQIYNPCGETMFFMTWGRKNGDASNCSWWPPVCTYEGMDSLLHLRYMMMADSNQAVVSPVGAVWRYLRNQYPSIDLYSADESHPSEAGSYAAACCFYTSIFRKDPSNISYDFTLSQDDAYNIRSAAKLVVYDSLFHWHIGEYDLVSEFSYEQINGYSYQFTNLSHNAIGQIWNFGPVTDTNSNPSYTFPGPGTYTVELSSFNHCDTIDKYHTLNVLETGLKNEPLLKEFSVFPNPANDKLALSLNFHGKVSVEIFNFNGECKLTFPQVSVRGIDISSLSPGLYYLKLKQGGYPKAIKFIKL